MFNSKLVSILDYEKEALTILNQNTRDYYASGAGSELTLRANRKAFNEIRPRFLRDVSTVDLSTVVFGDRVNLPVGIAPTAMQRLAHPDGEIANVRAAEAAGVIFILSTISTTSLEDVAAAAPKCIKWFQLYIFKNRTLTEKLIARAEKAGYKALVVTVDTPSFGIRRADVRNKFNLPPHLSLPHFAISKADQRSAAGSIMNFAISSAFDPSLTWNDIAWLRQQTKLPIVLKGILTAEDALIARNHKIDGILVSNHGARQIDGTPTTIEALPEIVKAVGKDIEIFIDGGITEGTDIFKALALGAKMCFMGRPALWGLVCDGENGVKSILDIIKMEMQSAMALSGCSSIEKISQEMVVHKSFYCSI